MFELPEYVTLAKQLNETIRCKQIAGGSLGNSPHKFVWYNRKPDEFASLVRHKVAGVAYSKGRWLFVPIEPGYVLVFGECGGKILFHSTGAGLPARYHLSLSFDGGTAISVMTQMWGAMELYEKGKELERQYIRDIRLTPLDNGFTVEYVSGLIDECIEAGKRSAKGLLTQDQLIPGLGNSIAQDILFYAKLHPKHPIDELDTRQRKLLHRAIVSMVSKIIEGGGRNDEWNLFGKPGGYVRVMDKNAAGKPCPECGMKVQKIQYLGGACYYCPRCQT